MQYRKSRKLDPVGSVLFKTLKKYGLFDKIKEQELFSGWESVVGERVAAHAKPTFFKFGKLFVSVDNPTWLSELRFLKEKLKKQINGQLGADKVKDIIFKVK